MRIHSDSITAADGGWPASPARSSSSTDPGRTTDPNRRGKTSRCPILSSTMKTEVSATTRIVDRRQIVRDLVDEIVLVSEADIAAHMRLVWERMKLTIEPSAAVGVAVACGDWMRKQKDHADVGVVLCGGNVDLSNLPFA